MKAIMLLAEAATGHPDGTFSMLRIGINRVNSSAEPISLASSLAIMLLPDPSDSGNNHEFEVRVIDEDGKDIATRLGAQFQVPSVRNPRINMVLGFQLQFPKFGWYRFSLNVDKVFLADWAVEVVKTEGGRK